MANRFYCVRSSHQRRLFMVYFAEVCGSTRTPRLRFSVRTRLFARFALRFPLCADSWSNRPFPVSGYCLPLRVPIDHRPALSRLPRVTPSRKVWNLSSVPVMLSLRLLR